ncbi:PHD finger domain-containing protein [Purpureocillium lavendulum]|uniref:PHD finger domain-containing protein n=1 Tax=Purpureocillium lavendulum TaxID=1247861 RepID=A0AB34G537_9HYPO|nr:PHD finger domain-containing protein [Purpureocillium lavendulum]
MATGGTEQEVITEAEAEAASPAAAAADDNKTPVDEAPPPPELDKDATTTVTDFLDFTEYLPSDIVRSLTLIGKLDDAYAEASLQVGDLTTTWGRLPSLAAHERPDPVKLRADISEQLDRAVSSRVFAHDEAVRMSENVNRHFNKAKVLLSKLQTMMDNYPTDEPKSPVASKSPQMTRAKLTVRATGEDGKKISRHKIPRITVPGEVLAPYDIEYDTCSDDSDISSDSESDIPATGRRTPAPAQRIKLISNKTPKSASRPPRPQYSSAAMSAAAAANAAALLNPPPENAVIGSADAPWLQLTNYELAKLRKRMKKNATWTPSETMVARELKTLGRGPDEYRDAKRKAEDEGKTFNPTVPTLVIDDESGTPQLPAGALSADSVGSEEHPTSNRGMKLNEAKKLKREALAKLAAEEAEESARQMAAAAKLFLGAPNSESKDGTPSGKSRANSRSSGKRKRDAEGESVEGADRSETPSRPLSKRTKTETPIPPPQPMLGHGGPASSADGGANGPLLTPGGSVVTQLETPVPIPLPPQSSARSAASPSSNASTVTTTTVPVKPPASETPVPLPRTEQRKTVTPVPPPTREGTRRETRGDAAKRTQQQTPVPQSAEQLPVRAGSRGLTPGATPGPDSRRPGSRGQAMSQEPPSSLAADRPRRASTARNTPVPEFKQPQKRSRRPAPGVVSTTNSGGNSAVGKRQAAPRKKARMKKDKGQVTEAETEMEEVDDEGNPIDPDEPRYCLCNRVSFGTMIQCDNDNCKYEWFHLECVGLTDVPARTTKWYCPDCRKVLNIGEKGEQQDEGYNPVYPQEGGLVDPAVRTFISDFYRISDRPDGDELWVGSFTKDAEVVLGPTVVRGEHAIRELRGTMRARPVHWRHRVEKAFPGRFQAATGAPGPAEAEVMLFGDMKQWAKDGDEHGADTAVIPWAVHMIVCKEGGEWKLARYRGWLQR